MRSTITIIFDSFCKRVIKNACIDHYRRNRVHRSRVRPLDPYSNSQATIRDKYFHYPVLFVACEHHIPIYDKNLVGALRTLASEKRLIVLLAYGVELSDREISERTQTSRRTVAYRRKRALEELRGWLEDA